MASRQIGGGGAQKPDRVDPEVAVKPAVFGRNHRLWQIGRHLAQGQRLTKEIPEGRQQTAIGSENGDTWAPLGVSQLAGVGQSEREVAENAAADDRRPQQQQYERFDRLSKNYAANAAPPRHALRRPSRAFLRVYAQPPFSHPERLRRQINDRAAASRSRRSCRRCRCRAAPTNRSPY